MKKILALTAPLALLATIASTDANAENVVLNPQVPIRFFATVVKGTIAVPPAQTGALAGFGCGNIMVSATSQATNPPPPGGLFSSPKWTRSVAATGNYASGQCSYSMYVPGGSAFFLDAGGHGNFNCDVIPTYVGPTGAAIGPVTVPFATTKIENFGITKVLCEVIR